MPITQVITALPAPPNPNTPATFATLAELFTVAQVAMQAEYNAMATQANTTAAAMNAAATGGALAVDYTFSSTITDADPGAGTLRLSAAIQNTATVIRTDLLDSAGVDWTTILDTLDDSTSAVKGFLKLHRVLDGAAFIMWSVSAVATVAGYRNITVVPVSWSAASPFTNGDALVLQFSRTGDKGDTGTTGATGASAAPFIDSTALIKGSADATKLVAFEADGLTTATTRTVTLPDKSGTMAMLSDIASNPALGAVGTATVTEAVGSNDSIAICELSATRAMGLYNNATDQPKAVLMDNTGVVIATVLIEATAMIGSTPQIVRLTATTALVIWSTAAATGVRAVVLTNAGASITVGTIVMLEAVTSNKHCLALHSATKVAAFYQNATGGNTRGVVLTIAGAAITVATPVTITTQATGELRSAAISATQSVVIFATLSAALSGIVVTEAATVLTPMSAGIGIADGPGTSGGSGDVCEISATRVGVVYGSERVASGMVFVMDVAGTGASATLQVGKQTPVVGANMPNRQRLKKLSATTLLLQSNTIVGNEMYLMPLTVRGDNLVPGDGKSVVRSGYGHDFCLPTATAALSFYADGNNSFYPTARTVALGTVV